MTILRKQRVHVFSKHDQVILKVGNLEVEMPYAASFKVAQHLRLASKDCIRYAKEGEHWSKFTVNDNMPTETTPYKISPKKRISPGKGFAWKITRDGEMIKCLFGNNELKFHFTTALQITTWLRHAGKLSKGWAGDGGKSMIAAGLLSDAEENYKLGVK
jgi:hypothetical protein